MAESPTTNRRLQKGTKGKRLQPMEGTLFCTAASFLLHIIDLIVKLQTYSALDTVTPAALVTTSTSIQDRQNLVEAVRRLNPASLKTAPGAFWDVEGAIKTVIYMIFCNNTFFLLFKSIIHFLVGYN